ncbi:hypothetical protein NIES4102_29290 [Chondrocystis sp. NIES-4102]|nr:hypothetical protein NIES4102_29290 [Chondrocystis sp. NIES-4102]
MLYKITEDLAIGNAAEAEELEQIANQGYHSFIDLCPSQEEGKLNPDLLKNSSLKYYSVPVERNNINQNTLERFMQTIELAPKPIYTRCVSGTRASLMTLLTLATQKNWTEEQFFERLALSGFNYAPDSLPDRFARHYLKTLKTNHS